MVNMDTPGLSFTKVWAHRADKGLLHALLVVAASMKLPVGEVNVEQVGSTDSESFAGKHIPRITIHSLTQQTLSVLHSPADNCRLCIRMTITTLTGSFRLTLHISMKIAVLSR